MNGNDDIERLLKSVAEKHKVNLNRLPKKVRRMIIELAEGALDAKRLGVVVGTK